MGIRQFWRNGRWEREEAGGYSYKKSMAAEDNYDSRWTGYSSKEEVEPAVKIKREHQDIKVYIQKHCWTKMFGWCRAAESEVSGLGMAKIREDGIVEVYDVFLLRQRCTSGYTELDDDAVAKKSFQLYKQNKDQTHFRFWWHTHYNFNTFWSGIDDNNAIGLMKANGEWELSLVINQKGDWLCRLDMMKPVRATFDELPVFLIENDKPMGRHRPSRFKRDIKRMVKPFVHQVSKDITPSAYKWPEARSHSSTGDYAGWESYYDQFNKDDKQLEFKKEEAQKEIAPDPKTKFNKTTINGKEAVEWGTDYVLYGGKLMRKSQLEAFEKCPCSHEVKDWEDCTCWMACDFCMEELIKRESLKTREEVKNG